MDDLNNQEENLIKQMDNMKIQKQQKPGGFTPVETNKKYKVQPFSKKQLRKKEIHRQSY